MVRTRQQHYFIFSLLRIALVLIDTAAFSGIWYSFYSEKLYTTFYARGDYAVIAIYLILFARMADIYGGFRLTISRISELIYSLFVAQVMTGFLLYVVTWLLMRHLPNVLPMFLLLGICTFISILWAKSANTIANRIMPPKRTLLIYDNDEAKANAESIIEKTPWRFSPAGSLRFSENEDEIIKTLVSGQIEAVMLCGVHSSQRNDILKYCIDKDIVVYLRPNHGDLIMSSARTATVANLPLMVCQRAVPSLFYLGAKRLLDIILSLFALIILSPLMLATAIAIKRYDHGPVLYRQTRLKRDGEQFEILKFRSMRTDAERVGGARLALQNDDRITPVGKVIRACRLDELPQLINILRGDMAIVGPRPERPEIAEKYSREIPEFPLRLQVKPGLTGYAQVNGKYNTSPYDKLQMDLIYIAHQSITSDIEIVLATIKILFMRESTEGVKDSTETQTIILADKAITHSGYNDSIQYK